MGQVCQKNLYNIDDYTGIEIEQLYLAADQIRDYFNNDQEYIVIKIIHINQLNYLF